MDDISARIVAWASAVPNNEDRKRQAFAKLKAEAPDVAGFVSAISQAFGKPAAVTIRFADGKRFTSGTFMAAQQYPDFAKRCAR